MNARQLRKRLEDLAICEFSSVEVRYFESGAESYKSKDFKFEVNPDVSIVLMSDSEGRVAYTDSEIENVIAGLEKDAHVERFLGI
ncbi:hypothetical protein VPFG_00180 [Vibrio phage nt-1]|uniref:Uncharacterized protein n=1 Tax=Vibrio phage nt-1 TaxID=115992 RepID=A0A068J714_9CAUD|nr:hypothetical protein VPFG_00180 [Vibrio phage nt-1]AIE13794.1 hypothetical protein VPFG_00180 [Vibrio phage nt-1]